MQSRGIRGNGRGVGLRALVEFPEKSKVSRYKWYTVCDCLLTDLALCDSTQCLYKLQPFLCSFTLLNILEPAHCLLNDSLYNAFELAMLLA